MVECLRFFEKLHLCLFVCYCCCFSTWYTYSSLIQPYIRISGFTAILMRTHIQRQNWVLQALEIRFKVWLNPSTIYSFCDKSDCLVASWKLASCLLYRSTYKWKDKGFNSDFKFMMERILILNWCMLIVLLQMYLDCTFFKYFKLV